MVSWGLWAGGPWVGGLVSVRAHTCSVGGGRGRDTTYRTWRPIARWRRGERSGARRVRGTLPPCLGLFRAGSMFVWSSAYETGSSQSLTVSKTQRSAGGCGRQHIACSGGSGGTGRSGGYASWGASMSAYGPSGSAHADLACRPPSGSSVPEVWLGQLPGRCLWCGWSGGGWHATCASNSFAAACRSVLTVGTICGAKPLTVVRNAGGPLTSECRRLSTATAVQSTPKSGLGGPSLQTWGLDWTAGVGCSHRHCSPK